MSLGSRELLERRVRALEDQVERLEAWIRARRKEEAEAREALFDGKSRHVPFDKR